MTVTVTATTALGLALLFSLPLFSMFLSLAVALLSCLVVSRPHLCSRLISCLAMPLSGLVPCRVMFLFLVFWRWSGDGAGQDSVGGGIRAVLPKKTTYPEQRDQHDHLINMAI